LAEKWCLTAYNALANTETLRTLSSTVDCARLCIAVNHT
jgi:hypothetical protein